jgi:hypothetical protein
MDIAYRSLSEISVKDLVAICHIDITTARRWRRGSNLPPEYILDFVNAKLLGDLGFLDPAWRGWVLRHGHLISPENWSMSMSDVLASRLHEAQLAAWRLEVNKMRADLANALVNRLEEQPTVDEWDVQIEMIAG